MRWLALVLMSCLPAIRVPTGALEPRGTPGRRVEVCVLIQERATHRRVEGVAELSLEPWEFAIASVVVKHPSGLVMIDPAFGEGVENDLARSPKLFAILMGPARDKHPLSEVMKTAGIEPHQVTTALITHAHWDHVGALGALPNARVLFSQQELEWARTLRRYVDQGVMPHHLARAKERLAYFKFSGPPRDGFPSSFDVFGDGSIVAVPLPGHTPGSTAYFVALPSGQSALFTGDATWTLRGVEVPAQKNPLVPLDSDREQLSHSIGLLHRLFEERRDILIVPAHEATQLAKLPECTPSFFGNAP